MVWSFLFDGDERRLRSTKYVMNLIRNDNYFTRTKEKRKTIQIDSLDQMLNRTFMKGTEHSHASAEKMCHDDKKWPSNAQTKALSMQLSFLHFRFSDKRRTQVRMYAPTNNCGQFYCMWRYWSVETALSPNFKS